MGKGGKQEGKGTSGSWQTGELADGGAGRREAGAGSWRRGVGTGELAARLAPGRKRNASGWIDILRERC